MSRFDLVLLDADGTLFDYDRAEATALARLFHVHGFLYSDRVLAVYREINGRVWQDFECGRISKAGLQSARFERLLAALDLTGDGVSLNDEYLDYLAEGHYLLPGAEQVCRELSQQTRLVLATNGIARCQRKRVALSAIRDYIDCIIVSEETGYRKPQAGFFQYAFDHCRYQDKSRAIMVGDSLTADIAGGTVFGITTCWFNPQCKRLEPHYHPDHQITDLTELLPIVLG